MKNLVAIQGAKGSFHHIASELYFGSGTQVVECMTFDETADHIVNQSTAVAVMAIENSIARVPAIEFLLENKLKSDTDPEVGRQVLVIFK